MLVATILGAFVALATAVPHPQQGLSTWSPALGSKTTCNKTSDKMIGFYVGPQLDYVVNNACAAMMPPCAYQDRVPDSFCIQTIDWPLDGVKSSTQDANVEKINGDKISGWDVKCKYQRPMTAFHKAENVIVTVTPATSALSASTLFWRVADCYGYFAYMLVKAEPQGCHNSKGFGIGSIVAGAGPLAGTKFEVTIVKST